MVKNAKSVSAASTKQHDVVQQQCFMQKQVWVEFALTGWCGRICKEGAVEAKRAPFQATPCDLSFRLNKMLVEHTLIRIFLLFLVWLEIFLFSISFMRL